MADPTYLMAPLQKINPVWGEGSFGWCLWRYARELGNGESD